MSESRFDASGPEWLPYKVLHVQHALSGLEVLVGNVPAIPARSVVRVDYASVGITKGTLEIAAGAELAWKDSVLDQSIPLIACAMSPSLEVTEAGVGVPVGPQFACAQLAGPFLLATQGNFYLGGLSDGLGGSTMWATVALSIYGGLFNL